MKLALPKIAPSDVIDSNIDTTGRTFTGGLSHSKANEATLNQILISGIAKDKLAYPIREIAANAWDANRTRAFDVHLPTPETPWFSIRDYGRGLPPNTYGRYVSLGDSTKRANDNVVGCFGLGAKSPFAYLLSSGQTPEYMVTSIHKGVKRIYLHSLTDSYAPQATLLSEEPTDEHSGLEVSWPTRLEDIGEVRDAAKHIIGLFPEPHRCAVPSRYDLYRINDTVEVMRSDNGTLRVRMGCVTYLTDIPLGSISAVVDVPIGSVSITASREDLGYDEPTKALLNTLPDMITDAIVQHIHVAVDASPTPRQAMSELPSYLRGFHTKWRAFNPNIDMILWARKSTSRLSERAAVLGYSFSLHNVSRGDRADLESFGYKVVDLTKVKLPPRPSGVYKREVLHRDSTDWEIESISPDETFICVTQGTGRRRSYYTNYADFGCRFRVEQSEIEALFEKFEGVETLVRVKGDDPVIDKSAGMVSGFLRTNMPPPPPPSQQIGCEDSLILETTPPPKYPFIQQLFAQIAAENPLPPAPEDSLDVDDATKTLWGIMPRPEAPVFRLKLPSYGPWLNITLLHRIRRELSYADAWDEFAMEAINARLSHHVEQSTGDREWDDTVGSDGRPALQVAA
jgi:hypothetical protein